MLNKIVKIFGDYKHLFIFVSTNKLKNKHYESNYLERQNNNL